MDGPVGSSATWRATLVLCLLLAFALRTHRLAAQALWSDEDITLDRVGAPAATILAELPPEHTPLYFLLLRAWAGPAGTSDFALRFPSVLAGVLAVAAAAVVGRGLAGQAAGAALALLMAVNPFLVWYGQEARMYALLSALGVAALAAALVARRRGGAWWAATGALAAATVYTHYYGALTVAILAAWAVIDVAGARRAAPARQVARGWLVAAGVAALLFLPWVGRVRLFLAFPGWRDPVPLGAIPGINLRAWAAGPVAEAPWLGLAVAAYGLLAVAGLLVLLRRRTAGAAKALAYVAVPAALAALAAYRRPDFHPRYFVAVVPGLYLLAATGATGLPRRGLWAVALACLVVPALPTLGRLYTDPAAQKQDYRGFVATVEHAAGHEDTVLFLDGPAYGLTRRYEMEDSPVKIVNLQSSGNEERPASERAARLAALARDYPHLWLATDGAEEGGTRDWLDGHAYSVGQSSFQDVALRRYYAPAPDPNAVGAAAPECAPGGPLCLAISYPPEAAAGAVLPVLLEWSGGAPPPAGLKVSVRLEGPDPGSAPLAAADIAGPTADQLAQRVGLTVPAAAQGSGRVRAIVYVADGKRELASWAGPPVALGGPAAP